MKRILIFIFLSAFAALSLNAQYTSPNTSVNWNLDSLVSHSTGTLTKVESTYFLNQDLTISINDTLKILSNEVILIAPDVEWTVYGTLIASPQSDYITFSAQDTTTAFAPIRFEGSSASLLRKCIIEYGAGIDLVSSDICIDSCAFRYNTDNGSSGAIDIYQSNPIITYNWIYDNDVCAISSGSNAGAAPYIYKNRIERNVRNNVNKPQINLGNSETDTIKIVGNEIIGVYDMAGGIAVSTLSGGTAQCIIDSNYIYGNRYGFAAIGYNIYSIVRNNIIDSNCIQNDPMLGGSGLNFYGGVSNSGIVHNNIIKNNLWGVTLQLEAAPNFGSISTDTTCIGQNFIFNNGNSGLPYNFYNNTPGNIFAENNYWGTYNLDTIEINIFHQPDSSSLGLVDYFPILPQPSAIVEKEFKTQAQQSTNISPNPVNDWLTVSFDDNTMFGENISVSMVNYNGIEVFASEYKASNKLTINVANLKQGLYFVKLYSNKGNSVLKFIKL